MSRTFALEAIEMLQNEYGVVSASFLKQLLALHYGMARDAYKQGHDDALREQRITEFIEEALKPEPTNVIQFKPKDRG